MGFAYDTAITTDADLFTFAAEQEIANLVVETGETDFSDVHKGVVNELIRDLKRLGFTPGNVSNTRDFAAELCFRVLMKIWAAEAAAGRPGASEKVAYYEKLWREAVASRFIDMTGSDEDPGAPLPRVMNMDAQAWFGGDDNTNPSVPEPGYSIPGFEEHVKGFGD